MVQMVGNFYQVLDRLNKEYKNTRERLEKFKQKFKKKQSKFDFMYLHEVPLSKRVLQLLQKRNMLQYKMQMRPMSQ